MASSSTSASRRCSSTTPERGFSFRNDGPLDMRMGADGPTAADVVNGMERARLARVIAVLGEEKKARAVASRDRSARARQKPITARVELAEIVASAVGRRRRDSHPSGDAHVPGAPHLRQPRARRAGRGARRVRAHPRRRRPARRRRLPFARGPHRQALPRRALRRAARRLAPSAGAGAGAADLRAADARRGRAGRTTRSRPIRGPARRGCARRAAPAPRRGRWTRSRSAFRRCRSFGIGGAWAMGAHRQFHPARG